VFKSENAPVSASVGGSAFAAALLMSRLTVFSPTSHSSTSPLRGIEAERNDVAIYAEDFPLGDGVPAVAQFQMLPA
jgi:hypothetical protein